MARVAQRACAVHTWHLAVPQHRPGMRSVSFRCGCGSHTQFTGSVCYGSYPLLQTAVLWVVYNNCVCDTVHTPSAAARTCGMTRWHRTVTQPSAALSVSSRCGRTGTGGAGVHVYIYMPLPLCSCSALSQCQ